MSNNELLSFADDKKSSYQTPTDDTSMCWNLLVVDDDIEVHAVTHLVLKNIQVLNKKIIMHSAYSAQQAKELMFGNTTFAFAIIDVVMETDKAGLELIKWIRANKKYDNIRLVLRTGQPGGAPKKEIISLYDIHDYKEKNELTSEKLFTLSYSCIRAYNDILRAKKMQLMLRHSEKMDVIGQLASGIVHDFNNILGVILGSVELLQESDFKNDKQTNNVNRINKAALMGKNIVNKLHAFTSNKVEQKERVNINDIITKIKIILEHATSHQAQVNFQLDSSIGLTYLDISDFETALFNLVINAHEAILANGIISINTSNFFIDDEFCRRNPGAVVGEYILLVVSDNGEGISTQDMPSIFNPFFTTKETGTGLGLAMVFDFVNRSLGYITLDSTLGLGSAFKIYLPKSK